MRIKIITELLALIHEGWQSLELFFWEGEDESGADCRSQNSQAHSSGPSFYFTTWEHQVKLKSSKFRMKSKCPDTCLITYGSCCCRRLLRQIPWLDFKVNWTLLGLPHYTRLRTAISVIEPYTLAGHWSREGAMQKQKRIGLGFSLFLLQDIL